MAKRAPNGDAVGDSIKKRSKGWHCIDCGSVWTDGCRQTHIDAAQREYAKLQQKRDEYHRERIACSKREENERIMMAEEDVLVPFPSPPSSLKEYAIELEKAIASRDYQIQRIADSRHVAPYMGMRYFLASMLAKAERRLAKVIARKP